jgi:hypothetical protein
MVEFRRKNEGMNAATDGMRPGEIVGVTKDARETLPILSVR